MWTSRYLAASVAILVQSLLSLPPLIQCLLLLEKSRRAWSLKRPRTRSARTFAITLFSRYLPRQLLKAQKLLLVSLSVLGGAWLLRIAEANCSGLVFVSNFPSQTVAIECSPTVPNLRAPSRCQYSHSKEFDALTMAETFEEAGGTWQLPWLSQTLVVLTFWYTPVAIDPSAGQEEETAQTF